MADWQFASDKWASMITSGEGEGGTTTSWGTSSAICRVRQISTFFLPKAPPESDVPKLSNLESIDHRGIAKHQQACYESSEQ